MLHYSVVFVVVALICSLFAFGGIAAGAAGVAKLLFILFAVLAVASFFMGLLARAPEMDLSGDVGEEAEDSGFDDADRGAMKTINENPILQSLLYDIDLMPEQLEHKSTDWDRMLFVVCHARLFIDQIEERQARIDALMLEYCPDEMTPEQKARWAACQRPVATEGVAGGG